MGVIEYVFCHAGMLVCLFVVDVADFWYVVIVKKPVIEFLIALLFRGPSFLVFYLSIGIPQILVKVIFVAVIVSPAHSYSKFICVGCCFFIGHRFWCGITEFAEGEQVSYDTIKLINY